MLRAIDSNSREWTRLCREEKWDVLLDAASNTHASAPEFNLLRVAVRCRRVPLQVLKSLNAVDPDWIAAANSLTGTILHEAIQYQCHPEVQHYLMEQMRVYNQNLFLVRDGRGRTALHCLLQHQSRRYGLQHQQLCQTLWSICPMAACFIDCDGNSSLTLLLQQATLPDSLILSILHTSLRQVPSIVSLAYTRKTPFRNPYSIPKEGVIQTVEFGATPLYYAVLAGRSFRILEAFLSVSGDAELSRMVTAHAEVALHVAVTTYTTDYDVLRILSSRQSLIATDSHGLSPLDWLWLAAVREWCTETNVGDWRHRVSRRRYLPAAFASRKRAFEQADPEFQTPAFQNRHEEQRQGLLKRVQSLLYPLATTSWAHAVCSVRCPLALRRLVLKNANAGLRLRDRNAGRYPLHCAATQGPYEFNYRTGVFADTPYVEREPSPLIDVVQAYPPACRATDMNGQLPLHIAIDRHHGDDEGIAALLHFYPASIHRRDGVSKLIPCLQAAVGSHSQLNTIYGLLRFDPSVLK